MTSNAPLDPPLLTLAISMYREHSLQENHRHKWQDLPVCKDTCPAGVIKYHPACHPRKYTTTGSIWRIPLARNTIYTRDISKKGRGGATRKYSLSSVHFSRTLECLC